MFLSFVVPVYNSMEYLPECLDSLMDQDISQDEYEIICVNDGSTDESINVLQKYQGQYRNIVVIDQENCGVSIARNNGLKIAQGEYIWFIDSDDFILRNILSELREVAEDTHADRIEVGVYRFENSLSEEEQVKYTEHQVKENLYFYNISCSCCLLRRSFLADNELSFKYPDVRYSEDSLFMFELNLCKPREIRVDKTVYFYRRIPGAACFRRDQCGIQIKAKSYYRVSVILKEYYRENAGDPKELADLLMSNLWSEMYALANLPLAMACNHLKKLHEAGLFPYRRPKACTLIKSYQTTRTDFVGKLFDIIYMNMHTIPGFLAMRMWILIERIKRKLQK